MAAPTAPKQSLVAVDTNILMDMAAGHGPTHDAITICLQRPNMGVVVTPTVVQELANGVDLWNEERGGLAESALGNLLDWGIQPINLIPVGHAICDQFSNALRRLGYLPDDERNDGLILAEAALAEAKVLVTWDKHLRAIPQDRLSIVLNDFHLPSVLVVAPTKLNELFHPQTRRR